MGEIEKFSFEGMTEVRVLNQDGEPWFVASDVCKVLGLDNTTAAIRGLDDDEKMQVRANINSSKVGGRAPFVVSESGLYSLVLRSRKAEAKRFKRWITAEVLPTIRKTGGAYIAPGSQAAMDLSDPDTALDALERALGVARELQAKNAQLEKRVEEDAPKVLLAEEFFESDGLMGLREAARSFSIPQNTFTAMLREWGWLDLYGTAAKAYATRQGYMENKVFVRQSGGQTVSGKLTRKGSERISIKLRSLAA